MTHWRRPHRGTSNAWIAASVVLAIVGLYAVAVLLAILVWGVMS